MSGKKSASRSAPKNKGSSPAKSAPRKKQGSRYDYVDLANKYLEDHDTSGLDIRIMSPVEAMRATLERVRKGQNAQCRPVPGDVNY